MNKNTYMKLSFKRAFKIYPTILLITILTIALITSVTFLLIKNNNDGAIKKRISVGILGDIEDTQLGMGIALLENLDSSRFFVEFLNFDSRDEANSALKNKKINGYIYIPEEFVNSIYYGENIPAEYVTLNNPSGIETILASNVADIVSKLVVETQNGVYSMQDIAEEAGKKSNIRQYSKELNLSYIQFILNRTNIFELTFVGVADLLSYAGYYICAILMFSLLLWGVSCNKLLAGRNLTLARALDSCGVKIGYQLLCEYIVFLSLTLFTSLVFATGLGIGTMYSAFGIEELKTATLFSCIVFVFKIIPVLIMITVIHKTLYEFIGGTVSGILVQILIAIVLGYITGCFYPSFFFPDTVQKFAYFLPSGTAFSYLKKVMSNTFSAYDLLLPFVYTLLFSTLMYYARRRDIRGGKE